MTVGGLAAAVMASSLFALVSTPQAQAAVTMDAAAAAKPVPELPRAARRTPVDATAKAAQASKTRFVAPEAAHHRVVVKQGASGAVEGTPFALSSLVVPAAAPLASVAAPSADVPGASPSATASASATPTSTPTESAAVGVDVLDAATLAKLGGATVGVQLGLPRGASSVDVTLDAAALGRSFGGNAASRLRLYAVPECARTTPAAAKCRPHQLKSRRAKGGRLVGTVTAKDGTASTQGLKVTVLAVTGPSGSGGDYTATPLQASGSWSQGMQSGSFTYSYPFTLPPSVGGAAPSLGLSYDSASVDGRTTASNGQVSDVGQGWSISQAFIERSFGACSNESDASSKGMSTWGDLCWSDDAMYTISLNGKSSELVPVGGGPLATEWRLKNDPGWRVQRLLHGNSTTNGDNGSANDLGEYWLVTTPDGTRYFMGSGKTPWATVNQDPPDLTASVWTVPVYGDDSGEPCYNNGKASCDQAWRWNLDRVVDSVGNTQAYLYNKETNSYAKGGSSAAASYDRGGHLWRIQYGARQGGSYTAWVNLQYLERCKEQIDYPFTPLNPTSGCPAFNNSNAASYPDVPTDLICTTSTCSTTKQAAPTFFSASRLYRVATFVVDAAGTSTGVDYWELRHKLPDPDGTGPEDPDLWLSRIDHIGADGADLRMPPTTFLGEILQNRVNVGSGDLALLKYRIDGVINELGGRVDVTYGHASVDAVCDSTIVANGYDPATNTRDCFPQYVKLPGSNTPGWAWFHKYLVKRVVQSDPASDTFVNTTAPTGGQLSEPIVTDYQYLGGAAWHHDDSHGLSTKGKSWAQWRGYQVLFVHQRKVVSGVIDPTLDRLRTRYVFYRGMNGDKKNAAGDVRTVTFGVTGDSAVPDYDYLNGQTAEVQVQTDTGTTLKRTWNQFWALKTVDVAETTGAAYESSHDAYMANIRSVLGFQMRGSNPDYIQTRKDYTYREPGTGGSPRDIGIGMTDRTIDFGNATVSGDEKCTELVYTWNVSTWTVRVSRDNTFASSLCTGTLLNRTDHLYDGQTTHTVNGQDAAHPVTAGLETETWVNRSATKIVKTKADYDTYGRVVATMDARNYVAGTNGKWATTAYSPSPGRPTTVTSTSIPLASGLKLTTSQTLSLTRQQALTSTDANGQITTLTYDQLGRLIAVRKPSRKTSVTPSMTIDYVVPPDPVNNPKPSGTQVKTLQAATATTADWVETWSFVDGWGRSIQSQSLSPTSAGGRVITLTRYNDRGQVQGQSGPMYVASGLGSGWYKPGVGAIPTETRSSYDELGRVFLSQTMVTGTEQFRTSTTWNGLDSRTSPPAGGDTETLVNPLGQVTDFREYGAGSTANVLYAKTQYVYYPDGKLKQVNTSDPAGLAKTQSQLNYSYDMQGHPVTSVDPDTGSATTTYDDNGNATVVTSEGGSRVITTDYDEWNRPTQVRRGTTNVISSTAYDTGVANAKGRVVSTNAVDTDSLGAKRTYSQSVGGYDVDGQVMSTTVNVPAGYGVQAAFTYTETPSYDAAGHVLTLTLPKVGTSDLPGETVTATWAAGLPATLTTKTDASSTPANTTSSLVGATQFDTLGRLAGRVWGPTATGDAKRAYSYDSLSRLATVTTGLRATDGTFNNVQQSDTYGYTGPTLTSVTDNLLNQVQCYRIDNVRRLTDAWTFSGSSGAVCNTTAGDSMAMTSDKVNKTGAPAYDQHWDYDTDNNLLSFQNQIPATPGTTTLAGRAATNQPLHAATSVTTGGVTTTLTYDAAGYLTKRSTPSGSSTVVDDLVWDDLHRLKKSTDNGAVSEFVYGPDGSRLIRKTPTGTTVYVGSSEINFASGSSSSSNSRRYYSLGGVQVAMRRGGSTVAYLANDGQGSTDISIDAATKAFERTRYTPYGSFRASSSGTPGPFGTGLSLTDKGWLGQTLDVSTGLNYLNARYYDSELAQFTAPDPIFHPDNPRSINPYTYANGNPIGAMDPSGLDPFESPSICAYTHCSYGTNQAESTMNPSQEAARAGSRGTGSIAEPVVGGRVKYIPYGMDTVEYCAQYNSIQCRADFDPSFPIHPSAPRDDYADRQMIMGVFSMIPIFGAPIDVLATIDSAAHGDWVGAGLSAAGIIFDQADLIKATRAAHRLDEASEAAAAAVAAGRDTDRATDLADDVVIVRGGASDVPLTGEVFSGVYGSSVGDAAAYVPHGTIRHTTVGAIRAEGGSVVVKPELTRSGIMNDRHVNICLSPGSCPFSSAIPNPVPKGQRIQ